MPNKHGAYLGGIRTLQHLRERCFVDKSTGCWHWRMSMWQGSPCVYFVDAAGKPQKMRGRRAALVLAGRPAPSGHVAFAVPTCRSADCVNPAHARSGPPAEAGRAVSESGHLQGSPERRVKAMKSARARGVLTEDIRREIRARPDETSRALADRFGVAETTVWQFRAGKTWQEVPGSSVFSGGLMARRPE